MGKKISLKEYKKSRFRLFNWLSEKVIPTLRRSGKYELNYADKQLLEKIQFRSFPKVTEADDIFAMMKSSEKGVADLDGRKELVITETGFFKMILAGPAPIARDFQKWMLTKVVPVLYETGQYRMTEEEMALVSIFCKGVPLP